MSSKSSQKGKLSSKSNQSNKFSKRTGKKDFAKPKLSPLGQSGQWLLPPSEQRFVSESLIKTESGLEVSCRVSGKSAEAVDKFTRGPLTTLKLSQFRPNSDPPHSRKAPNVEVNNQIPPPTSSDLQIELRPVENSRRGRSAMTVFTLGPIEIGSSHFYQINGGWPSATVERVAANGTLGVGLLFGSTWIAGATIFDATPQTVSSREDGEHICIVSGETGVTYNISGTWNATRSLP